MVFFNASHSGFVRQLTTPAIPSRSSSSVGRGEINELATMVERQHLVIQTLLMLLLEKKIISEKELQEWTAYVDGLDGNVDGRLRAEKSPKPCPACARNNAPDAPRCAYCGASLAIDIVDRRHQP